MNIERISPPPPPPPPAPPAEYHFTLSVEETRALYRLLNTQSVVKVLDGAIDARDVRRRLNNLGMASQGHYQDLLTKDQARTMARYGTLDDE